MEKLLIMSNLSFCHNGLTSRLLHRRQKASISGNGLSYVGCGLYNVRYGMSFVVIIESTDGFAPTQNCVCVLTISHIWTFFNGSTSAD